MFILLLMLAAFSIAGSAAYFSVTGLASTFHGTFWSTIVMGGSLEFGKLVATSYLYRYWKETQILLKTILVVLILCLMVLTSIGIFGVLSTGYQSDSIPLKQIEQKISLIDSEKHRLIERKQQIDNQIAELPSTTSRGRISLINGFKEEQTKITNRISSLEADELAIKTQLIQTQAHTGPIVYFAQAFGLDTDKASIYLIYLIVFIFDPMALALTLAVNIAVKKRELEKEPPVVIQEETLVVPPSEIEQPEEPDESYQMSYIDDEPVSDFQWDYIPTLEDYHEEKEPEEPKPIELPPRLDYSVTYSQPIYTYPPKEELLEPILLNEDPLPTESAISDIDEPKYVLEDQVNSYHYFKERVDRNEQLSPEEFAQYMTIRDSLQKQGFNVFI